MSWTTSNLDLRRLISDGPTDKYRFRKRVFGELNGTNTLFKTLEFRRVTNFTTAAAPLGIFKNGVLQSASYVTTDYTSTGEFVVSPAPEDGDILEATYYVQWFIDDELTEFLTNAAYWVGTTTPTTIAPGLIPAALHFAAADAYMKMAMRWRESQSDTFRLEDAPKADTTTQADAYAKLAEDFRTRATTLRTEYYTRQGRNLQPLFGSIAGAVPKITPQG